MPKSIRLTISTLFGIIIFLSKFLLPTPLDKMLVGIQATLLGLSSLLIGRFGATYTGLVSGGLLTILRSEFAPFSLIFAIAYGLMVDGFFHMFKVRENDDVKRGRVMIALSLSTVLIGVLSIWVTTIVELVPMIPLLYLTIILAGVPNGALAGYLTALIWKKYLTQATIMK